MIVRILSEGQYRVSDAVLERLNQYDNRLVDVVARGDRQEFQRLFQEMLDVVRTEGQPVSTEEIVTSDVMLPPPDTTLEEAREHFQGEGLIPG